MPLLFGVLTFYPQVETLKWISLTMVVVVSVRRLLVARLLGRGGAASPASTAA